MSEQEQREQWKVAEALKAADALNHMFGPALAAYHKEMERLAKISGRPLYTCLPGEGQIVVYPASNESEPEAGAPTAPVAPS